MFVVGGTSWNELPMIYTAQQPLNSVNYTVAVNFSDKAAVENNREYLMLNLNEVLVLPFEPDPFSVRNMRSYLTIYFINLNYIYITILYYALMSSHLIMYFLVSVEQPYDCTTLFFARFIYIIYHLG